VALGRLADPASLPAVVDVARARKANPEMRALAIAVLGLLGDPEQVPSLFRLTTDANYIARTDALQEAFSLL
jgi:HEAT repeat protein